MDCSLFSKKRRTGRSLQYVSFCCLFMLGSFFVPESKIKLQNSAMIL